MKYLEDVQILWKTAVLEEKSYSGVASQNEKLLSVLLMAIDTKNLISIKKKKKKSKTFTQKAMRKGT